MAGLFIGGTGAAGAKGFDSIGAPVNNADQEMFGHSESLTRTHIEQHWIPFLFQKPSPLAILHGHEIEDGEQFSKMLDHTGTVIDVQAYSQLPNYSEVEIPRGLSLEWIKINPDIYTFLTVGKGNEPAGYINAMPVENGLYSRIRSGSITDKEVTADGVLPFAGSKEVKVYLMSIAVDERYRRWDQGIYQNAYKQLLSGFLYKLVYYAKHHRCEVTHLLATAWTPEGRKMCRILGMEQVGKDRYDDPIFELNLRDLQKDSASRLMPELRKLLKVYRPLFYK